LTFAEILKDYYERTGRVWPNFDDAIHFADTEKAEALEVHLARKTQYIRNHPETKPKFTKEKLEEEIGDWIMMAQVAGMAEGVDPLAGLIRKLSRKAGVEYVLEDTPMAVSDKTSFPFKIILDPMMSSNDWKLVPSERVESSSACRVVNERVSEHITNCYEMLDAAIGRILDKLHIDVKDIPKENVRWVKSIDKDVTSLLIGEIKVLEYKFTGTCFKMWEAQ